MSQSIPRALTRNFLGNSPRWYKQTIIGFLILNPLILYTLGPATTGWILIFEFIFTLALALKCYPLQPGGLLALEAVAIGLASPETVYHEVAGNLDYDDYDYGDGGGQNRLQECVSHLNPFVLMISIPWIQ